LTGADAYRRLLGGGSARLSTTPGAARPLVERLCQADGLPAALRTDHGPPFAPPAFCGLRQLSVWWITLGIRPQRLDPGRPEPNGRHERLHRTLNADATRPPTPHQAAQPARCDGFCREDHHERPHEALHDRTPAALARPSLRSLPAMRPAPTYPGHSVGRRVRHAGTVRFQTRQLFISETRRQEDIALEETADGLWSIDGDDVLLARLDARDLQWYV
jgi:putative transposase